MSPEEELARNSMTGGLAAIAPRLESPPPNRTKFLADPASRFSQLVAEVGGESAAQLRATADATAAKRADRSCRGE